MTGIYDRVKSESAIGCDRNQQLAVGWSIEAFDTQGFGSWPDHAESTKAQLKRKGVLEARLLQDTGALKKSITYKAVKK